MKKVVLKAVKRTVVGKQVKALRREGKLPGVIYGRHMEPVSIALDAHEANIVIPRLTSSSIVTIDLEGAEYMTLVRERQKNYIKGLLTHIDFQAVSMDEKIRAEVAVHLIGVSGAVKNYNAVLVTNMNSIEVEALPAHLPERIDLDISVIEKIGDAIRVRDLQLPAEVEIHENPNNMIVVATAMKAEAEAVAVPGAEAAAGTEPEVIEKGKKEEEEAE
jgi:large subunit ribosomal protein L25